MPTTLRRLSLQEIEAVIVAFDSPKTPVRRIAVENFLISAPLDLEIEYQKMNLHTDAEMYGWNPQTVAAISEGLLRMRQPEPKAEPDAKQYRLTLTEDELKVLDSLVMVGMSTLISNADPGSMSAAIQPLTNQLATQRIVAAGEARKTAVNKVRVLAETLPS